MNIVSELISAILQVILFSLIPFIVWLIYGKKSGVTFLQYIGLYKCPVRAIGYSVLIAMILVFSGVGSIYYFTEMRALLTEKSVQGQLHQMGLSGQSIIILLILAWLKTSLSEEIFFRGFAGKRLIKLTGFAVGNLLQSLFFGIIHVVLFRALTKAGFAPLLFLFVLSTIAGWLIGYIKEKRADGSIIPGWIAHGLGNTISYFVVAYYIL